MPTDKHRIAAYLPKEVDEKFQVFKKEREVGDSQALILLMSEYFGVSQQVTYLNDSSLVKQVQELSSLLSELKSELSTKIGEERISELKSELLSELKVRDSSSKLESEPSKQLNTETEVSQVQKKVSRSRVKNKSVKPKEVANVVISMTAIQLEQRLGVKKSSVSKMKYECRNNIARFISWTKDKDPEGYGWEFNSDSKLFYQVAHQAESLA